MPIEIKELIIRASIRDEPADTGASERPSETSTNSDTAKEERIVTRCVEQVMDILRIQNER